MGKAKCDICGLEAPPLTVWGRLSYCDKCLRKARAEELRRRGVCITKAADFKSWSSRDLSELFWTQLGIFVKKPTLDGALLMSRAIDWAAHADHGLCNSFYHALEWAGIDLYAQIDEMKNKKG